MKVKFSKNTYKKFSNIMNRYPEKRAAMLPVLYLAEKEFGHISPEVEAYVAELLEVPPVKVHEVMTFYTLIARQPRGKYHFQVCRGLSCDLCGCEKLINYLVQKLKIAPGETSEDMKYTLTTVECLAACETGPMMQLNEEYVGKITEKKIDELLNAISSIK
ncbi:MAG: NADH-quinone oxidoreductase subunit NuoE [bacterium]